MTTTAKKPATLAEALVAFQAEAPHIPLDGRNTFFKNAKGEPSKYATLGAVMSAVRPVLTKHGLAIVQQPCAIHSATLELVPGLKTTLLHTSGEHIEESMQLAVDKPGPQAQGSALTYARRYAALAILGLVGDEDDDAQGAEAPAPAAKSETKFTPPKGARGAKGETATEEQADQLMGLISGLIADGKITAEQVTSAAGVSEITIATLATLPKAKAEELIDRLARYKANAAESNGS